MTGEITPSKMCWNIKDVTASTAFIAHVEQVKSELLLHWSIGFPLAHCILSPCIWTALWVNLLWTTQTYPLQCFSKYVKTRKCQNERIQFHIDVYEQKVKGFFEGLQPMKHRMKMAMTTIMSWNYYNQVVENEARACRFWLRPELSVSPFAVQLETTREVGDWAVITQTRASFVRVWKHNQFLCTWKEIPRWT